MLQKLALTLTMATFATAFMREDRRARMACVMFDDFTYFDIRALEKDDGAYRWQDGNNTLVWNFCDYVHTPMDWEDAPSATFAYIKNQYGDYHQLTSAKLDPISHTMRDPETSDTWIEFTQTSTTPCFYNSSDATEAAPRNYRFTTQVLCDPTIKGLGNAKILRASGLDTCTPYVVAAHEAGCPADPLFLRDLNEKAPWLWTVLLICLSPLLIFFGKQFFPWAMGMAAYGCAFTLLLIFFDVVGWMEQDAGWWACFLTALFVGATAFWLIFTYVEISVYFIGVAGGFFLGSMIFSLLLTCYQWNSFWLLLVFCVVFSAIGGYLAYDNSYVLVLLGTSGLGSYGFLRGLAMIFGGWPSEMSMWRNLWAGTPVIITWAFWVYLTIFVFLTIFGCYYQASRQEHQVLKELVMYRESCKRKGYNDAFVNIDIVQRDEDYKKV